MCPILLATLPPQDEWIGSHEPMLQSLSSGRIGLRDIGQNLVLYMPLGFVLAARGASLARVCTAAALLSLGTELLQYAIPGRNPAARDVVVNAAGALTGYAALRWSPGRKAAVGALHRSERWLADARRPDAPRASTLVRAWAVAVTGVLLGTAMLLRPAPPSGGLAVVSPLIDISPGPLRIGASGEHGGYFKGTIDDVRIYNRARSVDQIKRDMAQPVGRTAERDPSLRLAYAFDSAGGQVRDDSGGGHDGVISTAVWTEHGRFGGALTFDGVSSEVVVPPAPDLDLRDGMTLEAWVRTRGTPHGEASVISRSGVYYIDESSSFGGLRVSAAGGRFGKAPVYTYLRAPFPADEWTHLAATYDGQQLRIYANGALESAKVHWSPHRPNRAALNGVGLPTGLVRDARAFKAALGAPLVLDLELTCGVPDRRVAPVFLVNGLHSTEVFAVKAAGADLFVQPLVRANTLGLPAPAVRIVDALAGCAPGTAAAFTLNGSLQNPRVVRGDRSLTTVAPGLGSALSFLTRADLLRRWILPAIALVWLTILAVPFGFWGRRTAGTAGAIALVAAAFVLIPYAFQLRPIDSTETAALVTGFAAGVLARRLV